MVEVSKHKLRVFLCHASADKEAVRALYRRLVGDSVDAWLDEENLIPGQNWRDEIPKAVRESDIFLVCLSNRSINKEGYVQREIREALDVAEEKPEGTIFIIPARLENCSVPDRLKGYQWVDLFAENGYQRLMRALAIQAAKIRPGSPISVPPPAPPVRKRRIPYAAFAIAIACGCIGISALVIPQVKQYFSDPTLTPGVPSAPATTQTTISSPALPPVETDLPRPTFTPPLVSQITYGPWTGQVGRLEVSVNQVEVISQMAERKILRFYMSVNNQTNDALTLPLFGSFVAIDSNGQSYQADHRISDWPQNFPGALQVTGSVDLQDAVPNDISLMHISFSTIYGSLEFVGESITVSNIEVP